MRSIIKLFLLAVGSTLLFTACDKKDDLTTYGEGQTATLSTSAATLAPAAADSNSIALTLSWTTPNYATDTSNYKFIIEMDSTGKNFAKATSKTVVGKLSAAYLAKELNSMLLARNYAFNVPVDMDVRVISSYGNNNEQRISNTVKIRMTPYKIPPKVVLPTTNKLFIVGGATTGGWTNPVPVPSQELTRLDETTWGGIFNLTANQSYLLLAVNGMWDEKFGATGSNNSNNVDGDNFKKDGGDLLSPATTGLYKIVVDFQFGKFTVTPFTQQHGLPTDLFIVGDATPGEWSNPVPVPAQKFTRVSNGLYEIASLALTTGKNFLFLPTNGQWDKFGAVNNTASGIKLGGDFKPEGQDMPAPEVSGNYKISVNFITGKYTLVKL